MPEPRTKYAELFYRQRMCHFTAAEVILVFLCKQKYGETEHVVMSCAAM